MLQKHDPNPPQFSVPPGMEPSLIGNAPRPYQSVMERDYFGFEVLACFITINWNLLFSSTTSLALDILPSIQLWCLPPTALETVMPKFNLMLVTLFHQIPSRIILKTWLRMALCILRR